MDTEYCLKSKLNGNKTHQELMCRELMANDGEFLEVRGRCPTGGPDGGRDIEARTPDDELVHGAVSFKVNADDSVEARRGIRSKFLDDLQTSRDTGLNPVVFVFFTNVKLQNAEKDELKAIALKEGFRRCEIRDRQFLREELDNIRAIFIRQRYLGIEISKEEQYALIASLRADANRASLSSARMVSEAFYDTRTLIERGKDVSHCALCIKFSGLLTPQELDGFAVVCEIIPKKLAKETIAIQFEIAVSCTSAGHADVQRRAVTYLATENFPRTGSLDIYQIAQWDSDGNLNANGIERAEFGWLQAHRDRGSLRSTSVRLDTKVIPEHVIMCRDALSVSDLDGAQIRLYVTEGHAELIQAVDLEVNSVKRMQLGAIDFTYRDDVIPVFCPQSRVRDDFSRWTQISPEDSAAFTLSL